MHRQSIYFETIKAILAERGELRARALAEAVGVSAPTLFSAIKTPVIRGEIVKRTEGRDAYYSLPDQGGGSPEEPGEEVPAATFNASLWADGELILWNVQMNEDGRSLTLSANQAQMLRNLLRGG
jgi:predicted DNA-binding transcriptional regulator YafY